MFHLHTMLIGVMSLSTKIDLFLQEQTQSLDRYRKKWLGRLIAIGVSMSLNLLQSTRHRHIVALYLLDMLHSVP